MKVTLTKVTLTTLLLVSTLCGVAHAQPAAPSTRGFWNPTLGWVGVVTMAAGGALMVPCAASTPRIKAGLITLAVGGGMALVGFRRVTIAPRLGAQTVGVAVSVKW